MVTALPPKPSPAGSLQFNCPKRFIFSFICTVMSRILTGIQSSGKPHLGNLLGAIIPAIALSKKPGNDSFLFIADLHSLTAIKDAKERVENVRAVAAAWLACGFDVDKNCFYRQSRIPEVCELTWYLSCFTPYPMLANAHSFKDKSDRLSDVNAGLFTYPVLMTSDIIMYDAEFVPVGKDQQQHLEIARDIATSFNARYGETFVVPEARIDENLMTIPGTDGQKMSKSYDNAIDFLRKAVLLHRGQEIMQIIEATTARRDLEEARLLLWFLLLWFQDLLHLRSNPDKSQPLYNADQLTTLERFMGFTANADIAAIVWDIEKAVQAINDPRNYNPQLIFTDLAIALHRHLRG